MWDLSSEIEDLVLLRSDGHPLYNLSVVIDDISMGITHVIRGQDHLTNTHKQVLLYEALGAPVPRFAHLPLILAPNKGKLSKRKHGEVVSLTTYRDRGFVPAAFRNFLALLGWAPPEGKEVLSKEELVEYFSLEGIGRANAIFNFQENDPRRWTDDKALWMNAQYIRTMPIDELLPMVKTELRANKLWREEYDDDDRAWFSKTVDLIRERYFTLKDFSTQGRAYFSDDFDTRLIGAGRGTRFTGFCSSSFNASCTARSSCGSRPLMTSEAEYSTSMSGATPIFSTSHSPFML